VLALEKKGVARINSVKRTELYKVTGGILSVIQRKQILL
jgi:hypothetical protein